MVWIFMPPGASSTRANRRRAARRRISSLGAPCRSASSRLLCSSSSACAAHFCSCSAMRLAISAAAALVKVRQRMRAGGVPSSSRRSTRSVSTLVLPVPAEAATQTDACRVGGACAALALARLDGGGDRPCSFGVLRPAGRPFLDARQMGVVAEARRELGIGHGQIGGGRLRRRPRSVAASRRAPLRRAPSAIAFDLHDSSAAGSPPVSRQIGAAPRPAPPATPRTRRPQHRRFQRQLRREAELDLLRRCGTPPVL